ncbi:hypothetical protein [Moorena sp. SIO2C4]|uniref:hypothetical protein n=1 Tax=Moorena sp. SIO2C4 TaxID=2607824 RepID=UPI0013C79B43|nr:hypothetical protein [Moorena sp. SIO2C4]NES42288.1 hypothetical protein [Moorena sp. SIO2C4]
MSGSLRVGWLHSNDRFQYSYSPNQRFTAHKTLTGHWVAYRMLYRRCRQDMLGTSSELNARILELAAINISLSDDEYWVDLAAHELLRYPITSSSTSDATMQLIDEYMRAAHGLNTIPLTEQWDSLKKFRDWIVYLSNN